MRHFLCVFLLFSIFSAQHLKGQTFEGAVLLGTNLSQIDGDLLAGFNQIGMNGGIRVGVNFAERWKVTMGLQFAQGGSSFGNDEFSSSQFDNIRLNMVEVPLLLHFKEWKFNLNAGFMYSRLINYKIIDLVGEDLSDSIRFNNDIVSVALGASYYFNDNWGLDVMWNKGLTDLQADPDNNTFLTRNLSLRLVFIL